MPAEAFLAYLGERRPADVPTQLAVRQIHAADLYLACACERGDVRAFAAFDHCVRPLDRVLSRMGIDADVIRRALRAEDLGFEVLVAGR